MREQTRRAAALVVSTLEGTGRTGPRRTWRWTTDPSKPVAGRSQPRRAWGPHTVTTALTGSNPGGDQMAKILSVVWDDRT